MPKGTKIPIHIQQEVLLRFDDYRRQGQSIMQSCAQISLDLQQADEPYALPPKSVWAMLQRLRPTTDIAKMLLKASAVKLVKRVIKKANVAESMDILSRPGIDVLNPVAKGEMGNGPTGFFLTVNADTCGAVTVGAAIGQAPAPKQIAADVPFDPFSGPVGGFDEDTAKVHPRALGPSVVPGAGESRATVIARALAKIREAQDRGGENDPGHGGLQDADVQTAQTGHVTVT